jgi:hypothetical protein
MLADNVAKWKKLVAGIESEKDDLIQGEDELFYSLRDYWKKGDFAPQQCGQVLDEIAKYKNKHPASEIKEHLQEFRGLCRQYYTTDKTVFEAFQDAMGGKSKRKTKPKPPPVPPPNPLVPPPPDPNPEPDPEPRPNPYTQVFPEFEKKEKSFPWLILIVGFVLLLGAGGYVGWSKFYVPWKTDRDAPRYYAYATNTFLRSSQMAGVEYNVLAKVPYGGELLVYNNSSEWAEVKWNTTKGFLSSQFILPKRDFYLLNSIWGDTESKEIINTGKCRFALLNYFKSKGYYGQINEQIRQEVFGTESVTPDLVWQVFSKQTDSKTNTTYFKRITDKDSKFTDFAVIIKNVSSGQRKCLLFSFSEDETPRFEYEEDAPPTGDIFSIKAVNSANAYGESNVTTGFKIEYR